VNADVRFLGYHLPSVSAACSCRLRDRLLWEPSSREAVLADIRTNRPLADERADGYELALMLDTPFTNQAAVNDIVPLLLRRIGNERASLRAVVRAAEAGSCSMLLHSALLPSLGGQFGPHQHAGSYAAPT
jgi:hypothetical protein